MVFELKKDIKRDHFAMVPFLPPFSLKFQWTINKLRWKVPHDIFNIFHELVSWICFVNLSTWSQAHDHVKNRTTLTP